MDNEEWMNKRIELKMDHLVNNCLTTTDNKIKHIYFKNVDENKI